MGLAFEVGGDGAHHGVVTGAQPLEPGLRAGALFAGGAHAVEACAGQLVGFGQARFG